MKKFHYYFFSAWVYIVVTTALVTQVKGDLVIGLSPNTTHAELVNQIKPLLKFVLSSNVPPGTTVTVWDAWNLKTITSMTLPRLNYDSADARAVRLAANIKDLGNWIDSAAVIHPQAEVAGTAAVHLPEWLQAVSGEPVNGHRTTILFASPFCPTPDEPAFSMQDAKYPSDGLLQLPVSKVPYGVGDKHGRLTDNSIFIVYPSERNWANEFHRDRVTRFWSLFISLQGGKLVGFSSDTIHTWAVAMAANPPPLGSYQLDPSDSALVMHSATKRGLAVQTPPPAPVTVIAPQPVQAAIVETMPAKDNMDSKEVIPDKIPMPAKGNIGVAAVWSAGQGVDIDLWAAASPGQPEAFWHRPKAPGVHYFRDIRTSLSQKDSSNWQQNWEYVAIECVAPSQPTVWLNDYASTGPVDGFVRVLYNGQFVDHPFHFDVKKGNKGANAAFPARLHSPYWIEIKLSDFFPDAPLTATGR